MHIEDRIAALEDKIIFHGYQLADRLKEMHDYIDEIRRMLRWACEENLDSKALKEFSRTLKPPPGTKKSKSRKRSR